MLFLLIAILCFLFQFFLPWWIIAFIAFGMSAWKAYSSTNAFKSGFNALFLLWIVMGLVHTLPNQNLLANRVAQVLMLPDLPFNWIIMLLLTGLIGGLAGGFSALAGFYFRQAIMKPIA